MAICNAHTVRYQGEDNVKFVFEPLKTKTDWSKH